MFKDHRENTLEYIKRSANHISKDRLSKLKFDSNNGSITPPSSILKAVYKKAVNSSAKNYKHAAVIYRKSRIISIAENIIYKTHPCGAGPHTSSHAEIRAIMIAKHIGVKKGDKILVIRINRRGYIKLSKPCKDCMRLINQYNIRPVWSDEECLQNGSNIVNTNRRGTDLIQKL